MAKLDRELEYLLWYESHRERWIATPVVRNGPMLIDTEYGDAVPLYFIEEKAEDVDGP